MASSIQQVGMTSANQRMIEAALAALDGDAASVAGESQQQRQQGQQRGRQSSHAAGSLEPEPEPEPAVPAAASAVTKWLAGAIANVFGMDEAVEEGIEQMLPVATYMRSFESSDDLAQYMLDIFEQAADEDDVDWLINALDVQQARHDSGRTLATEDELNALWEASDATLAEGEEAANAAALRGQSRSAALATAGPTPQQPKPQGINTAPQDAVTRLNEAARRLRAKVSYSAGGTVEDVFSITVKVTREGQVLARGQGASPVGAEGMRQTAKLAAAQEALGAFPAELTESVEAWAETAPAAGDAPKDADWMDLKSAQKKAAISLGWKMASWNSGDPMAVCSTRWESLSQQGAAAHPLSTQAEDKCHSALKWGLLKPSHRTAAAIIVSQPFSMHPNSQHDTNGRYRHPKSQ